MGADTLAALATAVIAGVGAVGIWVSVSSKLSALETKLAGSEDLRKSQMENITLQISALRGAVEKHNSVVERTFRLEEQMTTIYRLHDELKEDVDAHHPPSA